jgi:transcriptional regulator with XRE-family HTH domain
MPKQNLKAETVPVPVARALKTLGENVVIARRRRGMVPADLAKKTGLALGTVRRVESGNVTTAISAYFTVLWALGLEREFEQLGAPERDAEGLALDRARALRPPRSSEEFSDDF